jgi:hypothetical protein
MDSTITRMTSGCSILPVKRQEFTSRTVIPPCALYGFREIALEGGQLAGDGQVSRF